MPLFPLGMVALEPLLEALDFARVRTNFINVLGSHPGWSAIIASSYVCAFASFIKPHLSEDHHRCKGAVDRVVHIFPKSFTRLVSPLGCPESVVDLKDANVSSRRILVSV